jgi:hypothetical protein
LVEGQQQIESVSDALVDAQTESLPTNHSEDLTRRFKTGFFPCRNSFKENGSFKPSLTLKTLLLLTH